MILNRQNKVRLAEQSLAKFLGDILQELNIAEAEVSVGFVSDSEIAKWNQRFRGKKGPTDVLSFPALSRRRVARHRRAKPLAGMQRGSGVDFLGDVAIAPETARRYAKKNGRTLDDELRVLMLHGVLHLMGYDHLTDTGQMDRIEQELRRKLGIA